MLVKNRVLFLSFVFIITTFYAFSQGKRNVVVFSMDGFRSDYIEKADTPAMDSIIRVGTYATTYPCFPSNTFPNHYSMATGLHPGNHGIVNNSFYDRDNNKVFSYKSKNDILDSYFWLGEPIWNTAKRQGVKTFVYHWVGSEAEIKGERADVWKKYTKENWYSKADSVVKWLSRDSDRQKLIMWYIVEPDAVGHDFSPDGEKTMSVVRDIDKLIAYFMSKVRKCECYENTDFLFVSDHGMAKVHNIININPYLKGLNIENIFLGAPTFIYTKTDAEKIVDRLRGVEHIKVYTPENLPDNYHYSGVKSRIADVIIVPEAGYYISPFKEALVASHGYDPFIKEMESPFFAVGPDFKQGYKGGKFQNLNLYVLISRLLGIEPAPNDGDINNVSDMLVCRP